VCPTSQGKFDASNTPQNQSEINQTAALQTAIVAKGRSHILANGGFDMNCLQPVVRSMPHATDSPAECAAKVTSTAARAANHSWYDMVVAYGSIEGGASYNDSTAAASVAAFLLVRGQHWLFSIGESNQCNPKAFPGAEGYRSGTPQCNASTNTMDPSTAALLVTDFGRPTELARPVGGKPNVFARKYQKATVTLDCNTFVGDFVLH
jgi:hypothetical protein